MRVLLVNRFFGEDQVPTGRMLRDLAQEFIARGHDVDVLTSQGTYAGASGTQTGTGAVRVRVAWTGGGGSRLVQWVLFFLQVCIRVPLSRWDRCVILTDPPFMGIAAALSRVLGRRGTYWWTMDLYPEALVARGMIARNGVSRFALASLNELALRALGGVICLGDRQRRRLEAYRRWTPRAAFSIVVPPWDRRRLPHVERAQNRFLRQFGWLDNRIALYAGNLGEAHAYEDILAAARVLTARGDTRWKFVFVVRGASRAALVTASKGMSNVAVLDYQPEELTADMLWSADVHLITMREGWEGVVVPSKLYGILSTHAPTLFIGPEDADTASDLRALDAGETAAPGTSADELVERLNRLAARGRAAGVPAPADGPGRIVDFVCAR